MIWTENSHGRKSLEQCIYYLLLWNTYLILFTNKYEDGSLVKANLYEL